MVSFSKNKSRTDRNFLFVPKNPASYGLLIDERELNEFSRVRRVRGLRNVEFAWQIWLLCKSRQTKKVADYLWYSPSRARDTRATGSGILSDAYRTYLHVWFPVEEIRTTVEMNYVRNFSDIKSGSVRRRAKNIFRHKRLILGGGRHFLPRYPHVVSATPVGIERVELPRKSRV